MRKIEITCSLEKANSIIKQLKTVEKDKKLIITIPIDITDDPENYMTLCTSPDVLKWEFSKEEEVLDLDLELEDEFLGDGLIPEDDNEDNSSLEVEPEPEETKMKFTILNGINLHFLIMATIYVSKNKPALIPGTNSWINEILKYSLDDDPFVQGMDRMTQLKITEKCYDLMRMHKEVILQDFYSIAKVIRKEVLKSPEYVNMEDIFKKINEYIME